MLHPANDAENCLIFIISQPTIISHNEYPVNLNDTNNSLITNFQINFIMIVGYDPFSQAFPSWDTVSVISQDIPRYPSRISNPFPSRESSHRPPPTSPPTGANEAPERARAPQRARHLGSVRSIRIPIWSKIRKSHGWFFLGMFKQNLFNGKIDGVFHGSPYGFCRYK